MIWNALGLDLSLSDSGVAVVASDETIVHLRSVPTSTSDGGRIERADYISSIICEVVEEFDPQLIVIEEYAHSRFTNQSTLGELGGIVKRDLWRTTGVAECWVTMTSSSAALGFTGNGGGKSADRKLRMLATARPMFQKYDNRVGGIPDSYWLNDNLADATGLAVAGIKKFTPSVLASMS